MEIVIISLLVVAAALFLYAKKRIKQANQQIDQIREDFEKERSSIRRDAKKRSGAVQWGKTIEHFVPFTSQFPVPPEDVVFIGMPIDYVGFSHTMSPTKCTVHFIEVKSGSAFLMEKQKNIKKAIEEGRVQFHEVNVDGNIVK